MEKTNLDEIARVLHGTAKNKGFWDGFHYDDSFTFYASKLALVHSEVTEVLEAIRKDKGDQEVVEELADVIIRTLDLYEGLIATGEIDSSISLDKVLYDKSLYNMARPERHGVRG